MSGQSFPQDVVAGTQLVVPSIHSPNFLTGVSGWTINLDGSAEFNNLTIRGTFTGTNFIINSSGAFFYSPSEAFGNLIVSIASAAGTDAFGNAYPEGINVTQGSISGVNISGTTIMGSTFNGTDFILNSSGAFFYSGTPANGNLTASIASSSGTDGFSNAYEAGVVSYFSSGGGNYAVSSGTFSAFGAAGVTIQNTGSNLTIPAGFAAAGSATGGGDAIFYSGEGGSDTASYIEMQSSVASSIPNGFMNVVAGRIQFGPSANAVWSDNLQIFSLPAAGGPFIGGEGWHSVSNGTNLSGTIRVMLLPWNAVWLDVTVSDSSSTAAGITCGSLPNANYYPADQHSFPLALNGSPNSLATVNARVNIPTSGAISITTTTTTGSPVAYSCSVIYPTN